MNTRKKYSREFKLDALSLVLDRGYTRRETNNAEQREYAWAKCNGMGAVYECCRASGV